VGVRGRGFGIRTPNLNTDGSRVCFAETTVVGLDVYVEVIVLVGAVFVQVAEMINTVSRVTKDCVD
jgi:hypothetical protein